MLEAGTQPVRSAEEVLILKPDLFISKVRSPATRLSSICCASRRTEARLLGFASGAVQRRSGFSADGSVTGGEAVDVADRQAERCRDSRARRLQRTSPRTASASDARLHRDGSGEQCRDSTSYPDNFGGNMDYNGMGEGVTVMLPVFEPGALLFLGDGHARQGDGEVTGGAIETSLDVDFSVDLIKKKRINWPRLENSDFIMVLGSSRAINEAMQHATTELMRWLMADYGFDERGASLLLGQAMEFEISNVVDPECTIVAKMRKRFLGQR